MGEGIGVLLIIAHYDLLYWGVRKVIAFTDSIRDFSQRTTPKNVLRYASAWINWWFINFHNPG